MKRSEVKAQQWADAKRLDELARPHLAAGVGVREAYRRALAEVRERELAKRVKVG